jgi:transposase
MEVIRKLYLDSDFDYYGIYLPDIDKVVYPSIKFKGAKIASEIRVSSTPFYWWEDFTGFTDKAEKRSISKLGFTTRKCIDSSDYELVEIPKKESLQDMLLKNSIAKIAEQYKISQYVVSGWVEKYNLSNQKNKKKTHNQNKKIKPNYPNKEELEKLLWEVPTTILAKRFGVSDVALAKLCKRIGIDKPPRGYWAKKAAENKV